MADLVTSESRRYLHGIQNTIISDDDTGAVQSIIPSNSQLALVDQMEVDGTLTVYGDAYVTSSKNADSLSGVNHNAIAGRDVYAAHPASAVALVPVGSVVATNMQSAVAELDAGKVASNPPLSPSTKTKITYDSKGLVTSGSDATASDIANVPYGGVVAVNVQDAINAVESHAASAQTAANTAQTAANNAATAATNAQTTANNAATAAANAQAAANSANAAASYADRLARSSNNLIKNGNSEDANPTGFEAAGVDSTPGFARNGSKCRSITTDSPYTELKLTPKIQCAEGDEFYFEGWAKSTWNTFPYTPRLLIRFVSATDTTTKWFLDGKSSLGTSWVKMAISGKAPAGTVAVEFRVDGGGTVVNGGLIAWDDFYACRKISAGMLEGDAIQSTTSDFSVTSVTASTSTTTGSIVVSGGIGCADYFTGKYRSSDGTAGLTATRTFYAASSSGGATNVLNTVTIKDGIITSWTQA